MKSILSILLILISFNLFAQDTICISKTIEHTLFSEHLEENRNYWVSLPLNYSDLGANRKIDRSIIVGIPHIDWKEKRGVDLTFSHSRVEYDGEVVDSTWYNNTNSGGGEKFYQYLTTELIADVNEKYSTNHHETLIGHSYGGYFGGYILTKDHPFEILHIYDPSIWFSNGEVTERFKQRTNKQAASSILR